MKKFKFTEDYIKLVKLLQWNKEYLHRVEEPLLFLDVYHELDMTNKDHKKFSKVTSLSVKS